MEWNQFLLGNAFDIMPQVEDKSVELIFSSLPDISQTEYADNVSKYQQFQTTAMNEFARIIKDYVGSSKVATVQPAWVTTPDNTTTFAIIADQAYDIWNKTQSIGTAKVTYNGPILAGAEIEIVSGDDYSNSDSRALEWTSTDWPDLTSAAIELQLRDRDDNAATVKTFAGSVVTPTGTAKVRVELTDVQTLTIDNYGQNSYRYMTRATLSGGNIITLAANFITVKKGLAAP